MTCWKSPSVIWDREREAQCLCNSPDPTASLSKMPDISYHAVLKHERKVSLWKQTEVGGTSSAGFSLISYLFFFCSKPQSQKWKKKAYPDVWEAKVLFSNTFTLQRVKCCRCGLRSTSNWHSIWVTVIHVNTNTLFTEKPALWISTSWSTQSPKTPSRHVTKTYFISVFIHTHTTKLHRNQPIFHQKKEKRVSWQLHARTCLRRSSQETFSTCLKLVTAMLKPKVNTLLKAVASKLRWNVSIV